MSRQLHFRLIARLVSLGKSHRMRTLKSRFPCRVISLSSSASRTCRTWQWNHTTRKSHYEEPLLCEFQQLAENGLYIINVVVAELDNEITRRRSASVWISTAGRESSLYYQCSRPFREFHLLNGVLSRWDGRLRGHNVAYNKLFVENSQSQQRSSARHEFHCLILWDDKGHHSYNHPCLREGVVWGNFFQMYGLMRE